MENEANLAPGYDGMVMTPAQTANFADVLGPTLARSWLPTQLECCATEGWDYAQQYAAAIEADPVASFFVRLFRNGTLATPYLTDSSSDTAAQSPVPVFGGTLTATFPARSLVTFDIR